MAGPDKQTRFTFTKDERLKSKKSIDELFSLKLFVQHPSLRIYYAPTELSTGYPAQFAFVVPKRQFQLATDRNRIKRIMRESVRHYKPIFYENLNQQQRQLSILLSYQGKDLPDTKQLDTIIVKLLQKLSASKI